MESTIFRILDSEGRSRVRDLITQVDIHKSGSPVKNMENHGLGFIMKNIVFHIYLGIVEYTYTV